MSLIVDIEIGYEDVGWVGWKPALPVESGGTEMALVACHECANAVSTEAAACPKCGAPVRIESSSADIAPTEVPIANVAPTGAASASVAPTQHRKISIPLIVGIVLMPYLFAWFLLRSGYSNGARIVSFIWAAIIGLQIIHNVASPPSANRHLSASVNALASPSATPSQSPEEVRKEADDVMKSIAEAQIRKMLKDEDSAVFRNSYGWIKHGKRVACGEVNSKNSFGAMAGYTHWMVLYEEDKAYLEDSFNRGSFGQKWNRYCAGYEDPLDRETDPTRIATRELRKAEHSCPSVTSANMSSDRSIHAYCSNGEDYMIKLNGGIYVSIKCSVSRKHHLDMC